MGLEGCFYGFGLWKMKFLNIPLIFAGFVLLGICVPATYRTIYYGFKGMKEEQGLLIQQKKKTWMQQGLNLWLQGVRPALKPLNYEDLYILMVSFLHLAELATSEFWLNLHHSRRPKQTFVKYTSLIYEPGATKLSFFFNSGPKQAVSFSLDEKCDQQTHKKWCLQLWYQSQENYPTMSHNNSTNALFWEIPP